MTNEIPLSDAEHQFRERLTPGELAGATAEATIEPYAPGTPAPPSASQRQIRLRSQLCSGGLIAYEVARRLTAAGEEVPFLGLFDAEPESKPISGESLGKRLKSRLDKLMELDFPDRMDYVRASVVNAASASGSYAHRAAARMKKAISPYGGPRSGSDEESLTPELLVKQIADFGVKMIAKYSPSSYSGKVWLFHGADVSSDINIRWASLALGGTESYLLAGEHLAMMEEPHVREVAARLNSCLRESAPLLQDHLRPPSNLSARAHSA